MYIDSKNIFLSCSYTNSYGQSTFSNSQRFDQLIKTIDSCQRISDSVNIVSEGSQLSENEKITLKEKAILLNYSIDNDNPTKNKSYGSLLLWINALNDIHINPSSDVYFLAGRYQLTDRFSTKDFQIGDFVFKKHWYTHERGGWYGTQLFKVSGAKIDVFKRILSYSKKYIYSMDLESSLYRSFYDLRIVPNEIEYVNCVGNLGLAGIESYH